MNARENEKRRVSAQLLTLPIIAAPDELEDTENPFQLTAPTSPLAHLKFDTVEEDLNKTLIQKTSFTVPSSVADFLPGIGEKSQERYQEILNKLYPNHKKRQYCLSKL